VIRYALPSQPEVAVDVVDSEDVQLMMEEYREQRAQGGWRVGGWWVQWAGAIGGWVWGSAGLALWGCASRMATHPSFAPHLLQVCAFGRWAAGSRFLECWTPAEGHLLCLAQARKSLHAWPQGWVLRGRGLTCTWSGSSSSRLAQSVLPAGLGLHRQGASGGRRPAARAGAA
jgi:hypothetical protein